MQSVAEVHSSQLLMHGLQLKASGAKVVDGQLAARMHVEVEVLNLCPATHSLQVVAAASEQILQFEMQRRKLLDAAL